MTATEETASAATPAAQPAGQRTLDVSVRALSWAVLAYLAVPVLLLAVYLHSPAVLVGAVLLVVVLVLGASARYSPDRTDARRSVITLRYWEVGGIAVLALTLALLGGAAGIVDQTWDWHKHNALLHDLTTMSWPVTYDSGPSLVYSFGIYLPAAAAAKVAGGTVVGAHVALMIWIALGLALVLTLVAGLFPPGRRLLFAAAALVTFGGADALGTRITAEGTPVTEWWAASEGVIVQYTGDMTALNWVPQHAIPSWIVGALFVRAWRAPRWADARMMLCVIGLAALWSPFATMGGAVLLAALVVRLLVQRTTLRWQHLWVDAGLGLALLPVALLLSLSSGGQEFTTTGIGPGRYLLFVVLELGVWVLLALFAGRLRWVLVPVLLVLLVLPLVKLGEYNDLAMRASMPALMALSVVAWTGVSDGLARGRRNVVRATVFVAALAAVALSVPTGYAEVERAVTGTPEGEIQPWDESVPDYLARLNSPPAIWDQYLTCPEGTAAEVLGLPACPGTAREAAGD